MTTNARDVIRHLDGSELDEAQLITDPTLNRMLDPYRTTAPLPYRCGRPRCNTIIAYWALTSQNARVVPGPRRRQRQDRIAGTHPASEGPDFLRQPGRATIIGGESDLTFPELDFEGRFDQAIEWAVKGDGTISVDANPEVGSGYPLRWTFTCPRCRTPATYTNRTMLRMFLTAVYTQQGQVRPGSIR